MRQALSALRVVELSDGLSVAYCGKQFAVWGADVVRLEPSGGSQLRKSEPTVPAAKGKRVSLEWEFLSANKRIKEFDADSPGMSEECLALIGAADAFITDWTAGRLRAAGIDLEELVRRAPRTVFLSLSDFGTTGPYAGFQATDLVLQALTGYMSFNGERGKPPLKAPANILPYACGVSAFVGTLAAIRQRNTTGRGQIVEVSALEAIASLVQYQRN